MFIISQLEYFHYSYYGPCVNRKLFLMNVPMLVKGLKSLRQVEQVIT